MARAALAAPGFVIVHRDAAADLGVLSFGNRFYDQLFDLELEHVLAQAV